jgi:hypothetical protein
VVLDSALDALPLHRDGKRSYAALLIAAIYLAPLLVILALFSGKPAGADAWIFLKSAPTLLIMPPVLIGLFVMGLRRKASLDIDPAGVCVAVNGKQRLYRWRDIADVRILNTRYQRNTVRVLLRGEISNNQTPNLIRPEFGYSAEALRDIILSGVKRWGAGGGGDGSHAFGHRGATGSANATTVVSVQPAEVQVQDSIKALNKKTLVSLSIVLAVFVGVDGFLTVSMVNSYFDVRALRERGVETQGAAEQLYIQYGRHGARYYHLRYAYGAETAANPTGPLVAAHGDQSVGSTYYSNLSVGDPVPVIYDPLKPGRSRINMNDWVHQRDPKTSLSFLWIPNVMFFGMAAIFGGAALIGYRKTRRSIEAERDRIFA